MCIALFSTAHPDYPLILINNRDALFDRPTAQAQFWNEPHSHILGGRDLLKAEQGTWLGITRQGRLAVLTNIYEPGSADNATQSRGSIPLAWLTEKTRSGDAEVQDNIDEQIFAEYLGQEFPSSGAFSLLYGRLRRGNRGIEPLAVVSSLSHGSKDLEWTADKAGLTGGLSNSLFQEPWPKVRLGETLLEKAIETSVKTSGLKDDFVSSLIGILDTNTCKNLSSLTEVVAEQKLRETIFVPPCPRRYPEKSHSLLYGTTQQTVILLDTKGHVTFVEKTHHAVEAPMMKRYEFDVEGW